MTTTVRVSFITSNGEKFDNGRFHLTRFMTHTPKYRVMGCCGSIHICIDNTRHSYPLELPMLNKHKLKEYNSLPELLCRIYIINKHKIILQFSKCWPEDDLDDLDDNYACYKLASICLD